ncbi:MAG: hypothetical protein KDE47_03320, partial [Caldilineaceae bacterium]|nr:hypothetical protein [Caldilineaceae bacterium]
KRWATWLAAQGPVGVADERHYWPQLTQRRTVSLPVDHPTAASENRVDSVEEVICSLTAEETAQLLRDLPTVYRTEINDILLTALVQSVGRWSDSQELYLNLEGHGREALTDEFDLSRTVGWFTSLFPVYLTVPNALTNHQPGKAIQSVKEQLRQIPRHGVGYGILRYLAQDESIVPAREPAISFNYLGQLDALFATGQPSSNSARLLLGAADEAMGTAQGPRQRRAHLLDINAMILDGALRVSWRYSHNVHNRTTIEALAQHYIAALRTLLNHCLSPEAGGFTPSDFPAAQFNQEELDQLIDRVTGDGGIPIQNIEEIYALSPIQEGLLYETLYAPDSGIYCTQLCLTLREPLDVGAFQAAWQQVIDRHAILRTAFFWEGLQKPLQVVCKAVKLPWQQLDWRQSALTDEMIEQRLKQFMDAERQQGFTLDQAPLARALLIQVNTTTSYFIWTHHHMLMDGWSLPLVFQEFLTLYDAILRGSATALQAPRPYREYIRWRQQQTFTEAERYWRTALQGFATPTLLGVEPSQAVPAADTSRVNSASHHAEQQLLLPQSLTADLVAFAKQQRLTPSVLFQGAWALLLHCYSGQDDLLFGTTVAGRPVDLPEVDTMVGLFINTVPLRISLLPDAPLLPWLQRIQSRQVDQELHTFATLVDIHNRRVLPRGVPVFENIFIYENYPFDPTLQSQTTELVQGDRTIDQTNYPLTVIVEPHAELRLRFLYDGNRYDAKVIAAMASQLQQLLVEMISSAEQLIKELPSIQAVALAREQALAEQPNEFAEVERALLATPLVADCHLMRRTMRDGDAAVVAYIVHDEGGDARTLQDLQQRLPVDLPTALRPEQYVPVNHIPLTAAGVVDEATLAAIPVIDDALIAAWEAQIATESAMAMAEFALIRQRAIDVLAPYHLSELLPTVRETGAAVAGSTVLWEPDDLKPEHVEGTGSLQRDRWVPALSDFGPLHIPADAPQTLSDALIQTAARFPDRGITFVAADE